MRKLFTGILLAAALPVSANIASDLEAGLSAEVAITNAITACGGGAACQELAIKEAIDAGIDSLSVLSSAIAAGADASTTLAAVVAADPSVVSNTDTGPQVTQIAYDAGLNTAEIDTAVTTGLTNASSPAAGPLSAPTDVGVVAPSISELPSVPVAPPLTPTTGISTAG